MENTNLDPTNNGGIPEPQGEPKELTNSVPPAEPVIEPVNRWAELERLNADLAKQNAELQNMVKEMTKNVNNLINNAVLSTPPDNPANKIVTPDKDTDALNNLF